MDDTALSGLKVMLHKESPCIVQQSDQCREMKARIKQRLPQRFGRDLQLAQR